MAFPSTVDNLIDGTTLIRASQVLGPQRVSVGPTWLNVRSDQYSGGATGNGSTDDSAAIQAALTAASPGAIVYVPPGNYAVGSQLTIPYGVEMRLTGRSSSTVTALGSFPINTPVIRLGPAGSIGVGCRFRGGAVDCGNVTGSTGIYSEGIQENSGVYEAMIRNYGSYGVRINQPVSGAQPQNFTIDDVEIFSGTGTGASAIGLAVTATSVSIPFREISRITVFATGSTQLTTAMQIDGGSAGIVRECHIENAVNGVLVGSVSGCFGTAFLSVTGNPNVTNLLVWATGTGSQNLLAEGINPQGGTNAIVDQITSTTLTSEQAIYAMGNGSSSQRSLICTDSTAGTRLKVLKISQSLAPPTPAGAVQSGQLFMGSGVPSNANGNNGDYYFRTDTPGTANQRLYVRSAGSWTGIV